MANGEHSDAIHLDSVTFAYPGCHNVLDVPALQVPSGESVFLHGPSGCGKTTLLSLIAGVLSPSSGSLRVLGRELKGMRAGTRDRLRGTGMGYIFQGFNLISYLSVQDNIALPCHLYAERRRRMKATTINEEVQRLAHRLDMAPWLSQPVSQLSVGQQQRVAIARALIGSPQLLIADEPTSSLDTDRRDSFLALLKELLHETASHGQQSTLLFVSHDASLSGHFDRTLSLPSLNTASRVPNA